MKRLGLAAAAGGAAFALRRLAPKVREMHGQCRDMMRTHCGSASAACHPE
jgi:hypothetical protein